MSGYVVQITLVFMLTFSNAHAKKPPGYVAPPKEYDPNPPKYEYGYRIQEDKVTQGKDEQRDGIYAQGRYYIENGTESSHNVRYFADDWGYHTVVEYSNVGPYGKSSTSFVLGEEAIKLKNNQKAIPQDPSDPGKAESLAKLDPSSQFSVPEPPANQVPAVLQQQPVQINPSPTLQAQFVQETPVQSIIIQPESEIQATSNKISDPVSQQTHVLLPNQPQFILQNDPQLQILTNPPAQESQSQEIFIQPQHIISNVGNNAKQPLFYFVQNQDPGLNVLQPIANIPQFSIQDIEKTSNQLTQLFQQLPSAEQSQQTNQLQLESLPQPQALIIHNQGEHENSNRDEAQELINISNNGITELKTGGQQTLETAALIKSPNRIVNFQHEADYKEFGTKLNPKPPQLNQNKLIESTKNLVSGIDVLNINAAQEQSLNDEIETSTLQTLLDRFITPTIVNTQHTVNIVSSTTLAPPVTTIQTSLLQEPIIVAESENDPDSKPVTERTDENAGSVSSTARITLAELIAKEKTDASSTDHVLVTPRPVSSKFLAPITAGVQLQHVDEQIFGDSGTVTTQGGRKEKVLVQVQNTIPYYLGMYQYPLGLDSQVDGDNITGSVEQKAIADIELGKTLLYFPGEESPKAEQLLQELPVEVDSNQLTGQLLPVEGKSEDEDQQQQQGATNEQVLQSPAYSEISLPVPEQPVQVVEKLISYLQPYPVEKIVERPVHVPIEVTKYVDRPYPVEVPVPYPQPYPVEKVVKEPYPVQVQVPVHVRVPVEKIVERKIPVPYYIEKPVEKIIEKPVEKIVERKIPVPYYIEKPVEKHIPHYIEKPYPVHEPVSSQAFLLQIPGLFSQQKYSTLVHDALRAENLHLQYGQKSNGEIGYPTPYAAQNNKYLPSKQSYAPRNLKKLNLLVFPRVNIANLPPITRNPHDLYQNYRYSNAQLNNGYLPPVAQHNNCQPEASESNKDIYRIKKPEEHLGLIPPKRPLFEEPRNQRTARANFNDKSIRLEYGFLPPLIPSLEIDEQGQPVEKDDNKK